ncbi:MAG: hypothetical protein ACRDTG_14110 [Pseudonocardiaceae bacterium]
MTTDLNPVCGDQPGESPPVLALLAELDAVIGAAEYPDQAAVAVLGVLREFGRATGRPQPTLADFLAATAAHLREHSLCAVSVSPFGELHLCGVDEGQEGWAIADWADSLHAPIELSAWLQSPVPGSAKATVSGAFGDPATPVPVVVWDVLPGAAELLGEHQGVTVSADQLRAWMATRATAAAVVTGGGERW